MEFWPVDFRANASTSSKKKGKGKETSGLNGQSIEPGALGAAALILGEGLPQWITAVQPNSRYPPRLVGKPVEVFPPTKPPPISIPKLTIQQRAEQGARFLRLYHPDVDIPFDLIKDELHLDEKQVAMDSVLDPYAGNRLAHLSMETKRKQVIPFLAFPCGVTGSELNVSPFRLTRDKKYVFSPSATPTVVFDTPIQQIITFSSNEAISQKTSLLAVRTHAVVSVLKLQSSTSSDVGEPPVETDTVFSLSLSETGKRRIVDMSSYSFFSSNPQILLVNDMGAVYSCQIHGQGKVLSSPRDIPVNDDDGLDRFWRLACKDPHSCMRASSKRVHLLDFRTRTTQTQELFCLRDVREYVTSLEAQYSGHTMCFATTSKILWYDDRNFRRPVLSIMHQRSFDRSLRVESIALGTSTLTTLSSAANHLVTVYDVNYASSGHFEVHGVPSLLPGSSELDLPVLGSLVCQLTSDEGQNYYHFQLSSRGSLWKTNVNFSSEDVSGSSDYSPDDFEWTDEMHALGRKGRMMTEDVGTLGEREHIIADLREIYEKMYDVQPNPTHVSEEDAEAVYQTLEKMPFFWQDMVGTTDHLLTTFDVAFQSGSEPVHASRADFLTESLLNTTRGFMALIRERIPISRLVFTAPWFHDLASLPPAMVPDMLTPPQTLFDMLREEALLHAATPQGMQRATEATQNLVLDLALSRHVYAPQSFSKTCIDASEDVDGADMLLRATKALSLGATDPPPLQFGYLRPMPNVIHKDGKHMERESDPNNDGKPEIPWGIRLLLSHWNVGSSPAEYSYKDPYVGENTSLTDQIPATDRKENRGTVGFTQQASIPAIVTAPRPPTVVSSLPRQTSLTRPSQPHAQSPYVSDPQLISMSSPARQPPFFANDDISWRETQGNFWLDPHSLSQDLPGPSTQPLSGPFGGGKRQLGTRKKVGKKRMGGF